MRAVVLTDPGVLELNWAWLPTWIGMNGRLKQEIEKELEPKIVGLPLTEQSLDHINDMVLDLLEKRCPLKGLRDYLDGLKFLHEG